VDTDGNSLSCLQFFCKSETVLKTKICSRKAIQRGSGSHSTLVQMCKGPFLCEPQLRVQ
jgi:hypothetical protein